jgi:hypothetical protein
MEVRTAMEDRTGREQQFDLVKVFSATKARDRAVLGERVTEWLRASSGLTIVDAAVRLSSDREFHCLTIILFCRTQP